MPSSLIPPDSLKRIGEVLSGPFTVRIELREAQRYAYAVGDLNPIYFDETAAIAAGYTTLTVPPLSVSYTHLTLPTKA